MALHRISVQCYHILTQDSIALHARTMVIPGMLPTSIAAPPLILSSPLVVGDKAWCSERCY